MDSAEDTVSCKKVHFSRPNTLGEKRESQRKRRTKQRLERKRGKLSDYKKSESDHERDLLFPNIKEIDRTELCSQQTERAICVGKGVFGTVTLMRWRQMKVAVKTIKRQKWC